MARFARLRGGGLYLPVGEPVGNPPSDERALVVKSDGTLALQLPDGTQTGVGGSSGWYDAQETFLRAAIPQLTQFERLKVGGSGSYPAGFADGAITGGALSSNAGTFPKLQVASAYQQMKSAAFGFSFRAKCNAIAASEFGMFGFSNGSSHHFLVGMDQGVSGTKFVYEAIGAANTLLPTSLNADTAWHTFAVTFDLATVTVYIDGNSVLTSAVTTNLVDEAMWPSIFGSVATGANAKLSRMVYGFADP